MDWRKIGKKLLFPPIWVQVVLTALSVAGLVYVFVGGHDTSPIAYVVYVIAFYTLSVVCVFCAMVLPKQYRQIKQRIYSNPIGNRYMSDPAFRIHVSLFASLAVNLLYVAMNVVSFFLYRSMWFVCLAVYYSILSVMRFILVRYVRIKKIGTDRRGELIRSVICSGILLTLNFFLSGAVLMIVYQNKGYEYHGMLIYVMAAYTFYITTHAIMNLFKYRKYQSPVMSTAKVISMASALVSMLNLETAMFAAFGGEMAQENQRLMIILTGAGVAITVITMSINMMVTCTRQLREITSAETRNNNGK